MPVLPDSIGLVAHLKSYALLLEPFDVSVYAVKLSGNVYALRTMWRTLVASDAMIRLTQFRH